MNLGPLFFLSVSWPWGWQSCLPSYQLLDSLILCIVALFLFHWFLLWFYYLLLLTALDSGKFASLILLKSWSSPLTCDSFPSPTPTIQTFGFFHGVPHFLYVLLLFFSYSGLTWYKSPPLSWSPDTLFSAWIILLVSLSFDFST